MNPYRILYLCLLLTAFGFLTAPTYLFAQISKGGSAINSFKDAGIFQVKEPFLAHAGNDAAFARFSENKNQWDSHILYQLKFRNGNLYAEKDRFTFSFTSWEDLGKIHQLKHAAPQNIDPSTIMMNRHAYQMIFVNASEAATVSGIHQFSDYENYYLGNDPSKWASNVRVFEGVYYKNLYKGIDLDMVGSGDGLKYNFYVGEGGDPSKIAIQYKGVDKLELKQGKINITTSVNYVTEQAPVAYQEINGVKQMVECRFVLNGNVVSFEFPKGYNRSLPLIIDPVLIFSTYTGSTSDNWGYTATYDAQGNAYAGGIVFGPGYPVTLGAFQTSFAPIPGGYRCDASITKFNPAGTQRIYSTFLGGSIVEQPHSMVVNSNNELIVFGSTGSSNFPVTAGAFQQNFMGGTNVTVSNVINFTNGSDIFIARFNQNGTALLGSTYVGGSSNDGLNAQTTLQWNYADHARGEVVVDELNNVYIASTTRSFNFPVTAGAFQTTLPGAQSGCVMKFNPNLTALTWSSYLGGTGSDAAYSLKADNAHNVYVCGGTTSTNFPATAGSIGSTYKGGVADGFVVRINPGGTAILNGSFLGTNQYDQAYLLDLDALNNVFVFGQTLGAYPVSAGVYSNPNSKQFLHKLSTNLGTTLFSTVIGSGSSTINISPTALMVDVCENVYMSGWGGEVNFNYGSGNSLGFTSGMPVTPDAFQSATDGSDFYIMVLNKDAQGLEYASYFGGSGPNGEHVDGGTSRFDQGGVIYQAVCAGCGATSIFPTTPGVVSNFNLSNNCNLALFKYDIQIAGVTVDVIANPATTGCGPFFVQFTADHVNAKDFYWDFGNGITSALMNPTHTYTTPGTYSVMLIGTDSITCSGITFIDTAYAQITVLASPSSPTVVTASICQGESYFAGEGLQTSSGTYYDTLTAGNGCDSVVQTNLTVLPNKATTENVSICQGQSYFAGGTLQTMAGTYVDTLPASNGCDSVVTTILAVQPSVHTTENISICSGQTYFAGGALQTTPGTYYDTTIISGCQNVLQTNLTVLPAPVTTVNISICAGESYFAGGAAQGSAGVYFDTLTAVNGCDSVIQTNLSILPHSSSTQNISICAGETFFVGGAAQGSAGVYFDTLTAVNGCDSVILTNLSILPHASSTQNISICVGETYFVGGAAQGSAGTYFDTLTAVNGCDSVILTNLSILPHASSTQNISICAGETYFVGGAAQGSAGVYFDTLTAVNGCDSVIQTNLSILPHASSTQNISICAGETFFAGGAAQGSAGVYFDTLTAVNGCDSVIQTNLSILPHASSTQNISICAGETYFVGGAAQGSAGTYFDTLVAANGCDSVVITNLSVLPNAFTLVEVSVCDGETYFAEGAAQGTAGSYFDTLTAFNGCDSVIQTNLTILPHAFTTIDTLICIGDTLNGFVFFADSILVDVYVAANGCNSTVTTNVTVELCCVPPVLHCDTVEIPNNQLACGTFTLPEPEVTADCDIVSLTNDYPGGPFPIGTTTVTWIVENVLGQADTCQQTVVYNPYGLLTSYTILGLESVQLMPHNNVNSGSVGVRAPGGEAYMANHTKVTSAGSFVMSSLMKTFPKTQVTTHLNSPANVALPAFEYSYGTASAPDVTIHTNSTLTLTDTVYGRIRLFQGATVIFDNPHGIVNVQDIRVNNKAAGANTVVKFNQCTKVRVKERFDMGPTCTINPDSMDVVIFVEASNTDAKDNQPVADIGPNALVFADFYVPNGVLYVHPGSNTEPAQMHGTFVAKWVYGSPDIIWNRKANCDNQYVCPTAVSQFKLAGLTEGESGLIQIDKDIKLEVFPNPVAEQAKVKFALPTSEKVKVEVLDISGKQINLLFDGDVQAQQVYEVVLNMSELYNGIYIIKLHAIGSNKLERLMIVKGF